VQARALVITDSVGSARFVNTEWTVLTGQVQGQWDGLGWVDVFDPAVRGTALDVLLARVGRGETFEDQWVLATGMTSRQGVSVVAVPDVVDDEVVGVVVSIQAELPAEVECAPDDQVTRLREPSEVLSLLGAVLNRTHQGAHKIGAMLFVHVDGCGMVHDQSEGGSAEDEAVAGLIASGVRPHDLVSRLSDGYFAVLCLDLPDVLEVVSIAESIRARLHGFPTGGPDRLNISIAIAENGHMSPVDLDVGAPGWRANTVGPSDGRGGGMHVPVTVRLFGDFEVECGLQRLGVRQLRRRPKQVLQLLVTARGRTVSKEELADKLWQEVPPRSYVATLESYISTLRRSLDPGAPRQKSVIETHPGGYRFAYERALVDIDRFDGLVAAADRVDVVEATARLEEALTLVRGDVLADEPYVDWAEELRSEYRRRVVDAMIDCGCCHLAIGDATSAIARAESALSLDNASDAACRLLMTAYYRDDRAGAALRAYERFRSRLFSELRVYPAGTTTELARAIEENGPVELPTRRARVTARADR
jgi:DNA-binding SARP family transcriptional activator